MCESVDFYHDVSLFYPYYYDIECLFIYIKINEYYCLLNSKKRKRIFLDFRQRKFSMKNKRKFFEQRKIFLKGKIFGSGLLLEFFYCEKEVSLEIDKINMLIRFYKTLQ